MDVPGPVPMPTGSFNKGVFPCLQLNFSLYGRIKHDKSLKFIVFLNFIIIFLILFPVQYLAAGAPLITADEILNKVLLNHLDLTSYEDSGIVIKSSETIDFDTHFIKADQSLFEWISPTDTYSRETLKKYPGWNIMQCGPINRTRMFTVDIGVTMPDLSKKKTLEWL